ncbi:MAG: hypothetical protein HZC38_13450 [Chloroflexi bacterium]|nr:hypothetical protein [Chloroflexota bacterium]
MPKTVLYSVDDLKRCYVRLPQVVKQADEYLQGVTREAYRNCRLISNEVLSRNPHTNKFLHRLLFEEYSSPLHLQNLIFSVVRYYVGATSAYLLYLLAYIAYRFFVPSRDVGNILDENQYVIDTFVPIADLLKIGRYEEIFFQGLLKTFQNHRVPHVVLPKFLGRLTPFSVIKIHKILHDAETPVVTEFDLLKFSDMCRLLIFVLLYPFDVLSIVWRRSWYGEIDKIFVAEMIEGIGCTSIQGFRRYFLGRRLGKFKNIGRVISWSENQTIDKSLFRGLREVKPSIPITSCQFFIAYLPYLCMHVTDSDKQHGMAPDCILVNGPAYLNSVSSVPKRLGVSLRNRDIFCRPIQCDEKNKCIIFLTYFVQLNFEIVDLCRRAPSVNQQAVAVRAHPVSPTKRLPRLADTWFYTNQDRFTLLDEAAILITSESSTAVEAASLGTSVIIVASQSTFTCNPMLDVGLGEIWEIAFNPEELEKSYHHLLNYRSRNSSRIMELASIYRQQCFVEPTSQNIVDVFRLRQVS